MPAEISILVLEDDPEWFDIIRRHLGPEYDLVHAETLKQAKQWLKAKNFHLAIVDLNLKDDLDTTDRSGFDLVRDMKRMEFLRDMSILILSRYDNAEELRTAFKRFKVFDFISKSKFLEMPFKDVVNDAVAASYGGVGIGE